MIQITNVSFRYEGWKEQCLKNTSLTISKGQCVLLTGPSGCGKTTITRMINGLIPSFYEGELTGKILINGKAVEEYLPEELSQTVGSVFQNPRSQFFNLDSTSEIAFGCENVGMSRDRIRLQVLQAAKDLDIERLLDRNVFELSNGEKQMIAIASIYAMDPEIYVMDEPSANLDTFAAMQLGKMIQRLKQMGKTIIIAEHRFHYLQGVAERVLYMEDGQICKDWTEQEFAHLDRKERHRLGLRSYQLRNENNMYNESRAKLKDYVEVHHVTTGYKRKKPILHNIQFQAAKGEVIAIIGKNGQGKSTLAKCLCGLMKESQGTIYLDHKSLSNRKRIGTFYLVMQDPNYQLFSDCVESEMNISLQPKKQQEKIETMKILSMLQLDEYLKRHPLSLSGGEKQRLTIATAVSQNASIILLDEPTSGLDYKNMCRVKELLLKIAAEGKTIFVITHDFEFITEACERVLHIENGKLMEDYFLEKGSQYKLENFFRV